MINAPTYLIDIIGKIVALVRKLVSHEQRKKIIDAIPNLSLLSIRCREHFKWYNDLFQKQPDIILVGY